ncbi:GEVED domain-containing protein [Lentimicrobium sp. S6]|uniref:GEVED domain-containing protein n=1 Tax=Lentimicrobium sp. S6 TaxID=2735872 RepID=UPI0015553E88|nr:GEVED domain-containing protein [Lentimicrobium sp. S6]NPD47124.1 S8 family serine peptidase [Lentimicrobium sp. S6]
MKFLNYYVMVVLGVLILSNGSFAQNVTQKSTLLNFANEKAQSFTVKKAEALRYAKKNDIPVFIENDEVFMELMSIDFYGNPQYYRTENEVAAKTISTNKVHTGGGSGLNLNGSGMTVHEWDGGAIRTSHQELTGRVTQVDGATTTHYHAQHVAGTLIGSGVVSSAKGMAPQAQLRAFDWNSDESEMATEAANGALVSNHSYGYGRGWSWNGSSWVWYGTTSISSQEDYLFGFYDTQARDWDIIAHNAPNYLIVKSAGNDRGDGPTNGSYPQDGPYDCISHSGVSKNILTVGAVEDISSGYSQVSDVVMSSFSSWGPCDDSRIKPDIVANGVGLYSADDDNDSDYQSLSGTSMSSPSTTGSLLLLQEHYNNLKGGNNFMKAATLKALVIHTADEAGTNIGPDYQFGWGLMNTLTAAQTITEDQSLNVLDELNLANGANYQRTVIAKGNEPIKVTIVWTDVAGTPTSNSLDPTTAMLVNDLDLRLSNGGTTHYPWSLTASSPSAAATNNGENNRDNVEVVYIANPTADASYTITVDHDGTISGGNQDFSIIISGIKTASTQPPVANFTQSATNINTGQSISFTDQTTYGPGAWSWSFPGGTPSSSTDQNPTVTYQTSGTYSVTLTATNASGSDTETKSNLISVSQAPITYCNSQGNDFSYEWISKVVMGSFTKSSGATGYSDFTGDIVSLNQGENVAVTLTPSFKSSTYAEYWKIWIDYNKDGDFEDAGEEVFSGNGSAVVAGSFTVDNGATGSTRMRVTMKYNANPSSCETFSYGEVEDYTVTFSAPLAPIAAFSASTTVINAGESIQFTDASTHNPSSWSWSFTGGTPSISTAQNPSITYNTPGNYTVSLVATNATGNDNETKTNYITVNAAPINYCSSQGNNFSYEWISKVTVNSFTKNSSGSSYSDYTADVIDLNSGSNTISLSPAFSSTVYNEVWRVWIDWNRDGDFADIDEEVFASALTSALVSGSFNSKAGFAGQTRMRVSMKWNAIPTYCESFSYGEVEDYTINVSTSNEELSFEASQIAYEVNIYPNPAQDYFIISQNEILDTEVMIYDMEGRLVMKRKLSDYQNTFNTSQLESGIYMIRLHQNEELLNRKIIIN